MPPVSDRIATLVSLAEKARKEGLLALEAQVKDIDDPFLKRGLQMGIDGTDPEELRAVLEGEITAKKAEDKVAAKFFTAMGGYAPTIGIIGTVVGLIHVLENLSEPRVPRPADRQRLRRHALGRPLREPLLAAHGRQDHCGSASCRPPRWSCWSRASPRSRPAPARAPSGRS